MDNVGWLDGWFVVKLICNKTLVVLLFCLLLRDGIVFPVYNVCLVCETDTRRRKKNRTSSSAYCSDKCGFLTNQPAGCCFFVVFWKELGFMMVDGRNIWVFRGSWIYSGSYFNYTQSTFFFMLCRFREWIFNSYQDKIGTAVTFFS